MQASWAGAMLRAYVGLVLEEAPWIVGAGMLGALAAWVALRRPRPLWLARLVAWRGLVPLVSGAVLALGLVWAVQRASIFDDAFISFRYARSLLEGHGLVFNPGERVEGYTNFLWTVALAAAAWLTHLELPLLALLGCLLCYVGCVLVLARIEGRVLGTALPLATVLFALQNWAVDYATSGMETGFATLWVLLGLWALVRREGPRGAALAGLALIAATFTRPDHGLFWVAGWLCLAWEHRARGAPGWRALWPRREGLASLGSYTASLVPYLVYLAWKLSYYGDWLPNTYYAKSGGSTYLSQGGLYALSFLLGAHLWLLLPSAVVGLWARAEGHGQRMLRGFCLVALPLYVLYVVKVGGDFMVGRFLVVTLPLWLLLAHRGVRRLLELHSGWAVLATAALVATVGGVEIIAPGPGTWYLSHEASHYRVVRWLPRVEIHHDNWIAGNQLHDLLVARGIHPVVATSGVGMVGYYSGLELVDLVGLTDQRVAHTRLRKRGMPGHEKHASRTYLDHRGVQLIRKRSYRPERWSDATAVDLGSEGDLHWHFNRYDAALVEQLEIRAPEVGFKRFERELDRWIRGASLLFPEVVEQDVAFFDRYYFSCNLDPVRREQVDRALDDARQRAALTAAAGAPAP